MVDFGNNILRRDSRTESILCATVDNNVTNCQMFSDRKIPNLLRFVPSKSASKKFHVKIAVCPAGNSGTIVTPPKPKSLWEIK